MREMDAASQQRLTWESPKLRSLHERYWTKHKHDFSQANFSRVQEWPSDSNDPFVSYCIANGYLHTPPLDDVDLLDNEIHPILARENWVSHVLMKRFFDIWRYTLMLASQLIESDVSIDWFVHLRYGVLSCDEFDRLYIRPSYEQQSDLPRLRTLVRKELRALAGSIRFTWLSSRSPGREWLTGTAGLTKPSIKDMMKLYEADLEGSSSPAVTSCGGSFGADMPTICLPIDLYYMTLASQGNPFLCQSTLFRRYLGQAVLLVHEIAHAVGNLWGRSSADGIEVLHSQSDTFPELGLSWERHVFRGKLSCDLVGPATAMKIEDSYPADGQITSTPLVAFLKMEYVNQFFLKSTWMDLDKVRERLYAPTIDQSQEFFYFGRFLRGVYTTVVYIDERSVSDEYLYFRLQEREGVVITWERNQARKYHLDEVVRYYKQIWKQEEAEAWASGTCLPPHFYLHITGAWASFKDSNMQSIKDIFWGQAQGDHIE